MTEEWKPIKDWEKYYEISNFGNVRNIKTRKLLTGDINNCGYHRVCLYHNNKKKKYFRHRLVAEHFLEKVKDKNFVNHIDGNKANNNVNNLEWVTRKENMVHARDTGLLEKRTNKPFIVIFNNMKQKKYNNLEQLAKEIDISYAMISLWLNKKYDTYKDYGIYDIYYEK